MFGARVRRSLPVRSSGFDSDDRSVHVPKRLRANFLKAGLPQPVFAFRAGVLKASCRFDQHVEARQ